ncbi:hypothetical protein [Actinophytocola oryzae]|uniref:Uncharacterized protein n=1 Tax=Actinophytocola oryzae TaxID=502181 RepID=A0A4R7W1S3_9PSEU|nr:hypothetical protein [Actinophytocola oryzae]TDV56065.1 hypothetical protein CLV71_102126 [Actinophytocola oryzae]
MVAMFSQVYDRWLYTRLDLELVRLIGELRAMDPAITRQQLIVQQHQSYLGEVDMPAPRDPAAKRECVDNLRSRRRYHAELDRVTGFRELHRGQRDEAGRKLQEMLANRSRLIEVTVDRLHGHVAQAQALNGGPARSLVVDLTAYLDRIAELAEPPQAPPE